MGIVRTIIWVLLAVILFAFAAMNWDPVDVKIWPASEAKDTLVWSTKLPAVIFLSFLIGFLPPWFGWRAARWTLKRRLENSERQLSELRAAASRRPEPAPLPGAPAPTSAADVPPSSLDMP